jgi:4-diphosphocytidyl-2-C-methyl-D-erythritol kinase
MWGIGRETAPVPALPALPAVLVNPGVPLATAAVFQALGAPPIAARGAPPEVPAQFADMAAVVAHLRARGNDLQPAAMAVCPPIGAVLAALLAEPSTLVAGMSGSGPTCFAIVETATAAGAAASGIRARHPGWWAVATTLR